MNTLVILGVMISCRTEKTPDNDTIGVAVADADGDGMPDCDSVVVGGVSDPGM